MSNTQAISLQPQQLLTLATQVLYKCFFEANREQSKQIYNEIEKGKQTTLFSMDMGQAGQMQGDLALDHSEFKGKLNYSQFRAALGGMINHISEKAKNKEETDTFTNQQTGELLFHAPGFVEEKGQLNVLLLSVVQPGRGSMVFRLMFVDPDQYVQKGTEQEGS